MPEPTATPDRGRETGVAVSQLKSFGGLSVKLTSKSELRAGDDLPYSGLTNVVHAPSDEQTTPMSATS